MVPESGKKLTSAGEAETTASMQAQNNLDVNKSDAQNPAFSNTTREEKTAAQVDNANDKKGANSGASVQNKFDFTERDSQDPLVLARIRKEAGFSMAGNNGNADIKLGGDKMAQKHLDATVTEQGDRASKAEQIVPAAAKPDQTAPNPIQERNFNISPPGQENSNG
jgi:hypothetical protein